MRSSAIRDLYDSFFIFPKGVDRMSKDSKVLNDWTSSESPEAGNPSGLWVIREITEDKIVSKDPKSWALARLDREQLEASADLIGTQRTYRLEPEETTSSITHTRTVQLLHWYARHRSSSSATHLWKPP
jgi:hypothetical protein